MWFIRLSLMYITLLNELAYNITLLCEWALYFHEPKVSEIVAHECNNHDIAQ